MTNPLRLIGYDKNAARHFLIIGLASQVIYAVDNIREVLYEQYASYLGVNNTELGFLYTISSTCYLLFLFFGWIHNIFRPKGLVLFGLSANLLIAFVVLFRPQMGFSALAPWYVLYSIKELAFWPAVLNYVRSFSREGSQGLTFSLHEFMRRSASIALSLMAIGCVALAGSAFLGVRLAIFLDSLLIALFIVLVFLFVPNIEPTASAPSSFAQKASNYLRLLSTPEIWLIGICGMATTMNFYILQLIVPFLRQGFSLPPAQAGLIALLISSVVGCCVSLMGGLIADKVFKSPARMARYLLYMLFVSTVFIIILPKNPAYLTSCITALCLIASAVFMLRGLTFAPVAEIGIPQEVNGAAVSIVSFITFSPGLWMYMFNGKMLDVFKDNVLTAYNIMFGLCLAMNLIAILSSHRLAWRIKKAAQDQAPAL